MDLKHNDGTGSAETKQDVLDDAGDAVDGEEPMGPRFIPLPRVRGPAMLTDTLPSAANNVLVCDYIAQVIDMCMDRLNNVAVDAGTATPKQRWTIDADQLHQHLDWLKTFVMANCSKFAATSARVSLTGLAFYAFLALSALRADSPQPSAPRADSPQPSAPRADLPQHSSSASSSAAPVRQAQIEDIKNIIDQLCKMTTMSNSTPTEEWMNQIHLALRNLEDKSRVGFVHDPRSAFTAHRDVLDKAAKTFGHCYLQLHYWAKMQSATLTPDDLAPATRLILQQREGFMKLQPSDDFRTRFGNLVYAHWLGSAGRVPVNAPGTKYPPLSSLAHDVFPPMLGKQLHIGIKELASFPYKPPIQQKPVAMDTKDTKDSKDSKAAPKELVVEKLPSPGHLEDLLHILVFAYQFEQEKGMKPMLWFHRYFLSAFDFGLHHGNLQKTKRHLELARPTVFPLLGKWAVSTHDQHLYVCSTGTEAIATWLTLLRLFYHDALEGEA